MSFIFSCVTLRDVNIRSFKTEADSGNFLAFAKAFIESWPDSRLLRFLFSK